MSHPFFSIIIPTFNRASFLPVTIDSILHQIFVDYEIIIIDDGSMDNTKDVLKPYLDNHSSIKYFYQENLERGAARNFGIKRAEGEYFVFFDSDDIMLPGYLNILYHKIQLLNHPNFIAAKYAFKQGSKIKNSPLKSLKEGWYDINLLLPGNPLACHFCIKKEDALLKLFEEKREYTTMEDWMFLVQNISNRQIYIINKVAIWMVEHPAQSMQQNHGKIITARKLATEWIIEKNILSNEQNKKLRGYSFYFCSIHSHLDNERRIALKYLFHSIKFNTPGYNFFLLFIKIVIGRKNICLIKLFLNQWYFLFPKRKNQLRNREAGKYQQCARCVIDTVKSVAK